MRPRINHGSLHGTLPLHRKLVAFVALFVFVACASMSRIFTMCDSFRSLAIRWSTSHDDTTSEPFVSSTHLCPAVNINPSNLKSQSNEDVQLLQWFRGLCNGTYLEIGGLDGVKYSNTYAFNKELGWRGVLVELSSLNFDGLVKNRPNELVNIHAGVCDRKRLLHYVEDKSEVSGIWEFAPQTFKDIFWRDITLESPNVKPILCAPLAELLEPHLGSSFYFDFFSLDVEGAEFEVLKAIDFTKLGFGIILTEADAHNQRKNMALRTFLEWNGYSFFMEYERSYWFVNKKFWQIYGERLYMAEKAFK